MNSLRFGGWVSATIAVVLFLFGLAGIPDDLATWAEWLEIIDYEFAQVLAFITGSMAVLVWVLIQLLQHGHKIPFLRAWFLPQQTEPEKSRSTTRVIAPPPPPVTWISPDEAGATLKRSSLIRMRVPNDVTLAHVLARALGDTSNTPGEVRAGELVRKLLRDFAVQHPNGVSDGTYGKELLEWWIDEQAAMGNSFRAH